MPELIHLILLLMVSQFVSAHRPIISELLPLSLPPSLSPSLSPPAITVSIKPASSKTPLVKRVELVFDGDTPRPGKVECLSDPNPQNVNHFTRERKCVCVCGGEPGTEAKCVCRDSNSPPSANPVLRSTQRQLRRSKT